MDNFTPGWYLLYTMPRHERKIAARLMELTVEAFFPTSRHLKEGQGKKRWVDEPLFPSYIFVYLKSAPDYFTGLNMEGVWYYVRTGKTIARVDQKVIDDIRLLCTQGNSVQVSSDSYAPGRRLVVQRGALSGLSCEVVQSNGREKLLVRMSLLQRNLLVTVAAESFAGSYA
jgi:transcriptional antiterminator RfaH